MDQIKNKQKILITGASGLLGHAASEYFSNYFDVYGIYNEHFVTDKKAKYYKCDISNATSIYKLLSEIKPNIIFHSAAIVDLESCEKYKSKTDLVNIIATDYLVKYCKENLVKIIYISTDSFFDGPQEMFTELDAPNPQNYYSVTKYKSEEIVKSLMNNYLIVRLNIYGWNYQKKTSLAEWMLYKLENNENVNAFTDVYYTPIFTETAIQCIHDLILMGASGLFHVSTDRKISKYDFCNLLADEFHLNKTLIHKASIKNMKFIAPRSSNMSLSNEKFKKLFPNRIMTVENDLKLFRKTRGFK